MSSINCSNILGRLREGLRNVPWGTALEMGTFVGAVCVLSPGETDRCTYSESDSFGINKDSLRYLAALSTFVACASYAGSLCLRKISAYCLPSSPASDSESRCRKTAKEVGNFAVTRGIPLAGAIYTAKAVSPYIAVPFAKLLKNLPCFESANGVEQFLEDCKQFIDIYGLMPGGEFMNSNDMLFFSGKIAYELVIKAGIPVATGLYLAQRLTEYVNRSRAPLAAERALLRPAQEHPV